MKDLDTLEVVLEDLIDNLTDTTLLVKTDDEKTHDLKIMLHTLKAVQTYINDLCDDINLF